MQPFEFLEPQSVEEAVALLAAEPGTSALVAGGSDLLSEIKEGVAQPQRLVSLAGIEGLEGISQRDDGLTIGAMTTIADIGSHPVVSRDYTALASAAAGLATPQIRNVGTLGGNLNQRPRCWYYRHPLTVCLKKGGSICYALAGNSKYLCVTGGDRCYIVHPSDTAVALSALDARIGIAGPQGTRTAVTGEFFTTPAADITRENSLAPGEIVAGVHLPAPSGEGQRKSIYLKSRERESGDFALVSVAAVVTVAGGEVSSAAVCLGGVAPVPYRAREVEEHLLGKALADVEPVQAGGLALPDPRPMAQNGYKVEMARNMVARALSQLLTGF